MRIMPLLVAACLLASLGCDVGNFTGLSSEILTVSVTTVGSRLDPNGYILAITSRQDEPIGVNETKTFNMLKITVTVELRHVAPNCAVADDSVTVDMNGPATVAFFVECT